MISIRHTGIYVKDIEKIEGFYTAVFHMTAICSKQPDSGLLFDELIGEKNVVIETSKLITPYGKDQGQGDMLELVKVDTDLLDVDKNHMGFPIYLPGTAHLAFGVEDIEETVEKIKSMNGTLSTSIRVMQNGNKCCFCRDPEGNWIELIQRKEY